MSKSRPKHLTCRCGNPKKGWDLMCKECWKTIPLNLRRALSGAVSIEGRRAAVRAILQYRNNDTTFDHIKSAVRTMREHRTQRPLRDPRDPGAWDD